MTRDLLKIGVKGSAVAGFLAHVVKEMFSQCMHWPITKECLLEWTAFRLVMSWNGAA